MDNKDKWTKLVDQMTTDEKIDMMSGPVTMDMMNQKKREGYHFNFFPFPAGGNVRLGIQPLLFTDGPRGITCGEGRSTCFPVTMCRAATFDPKLEEQIGHAIGREARSYGANLYGGVCLNLPYHPGWGRAQESYGEDSTVIGAMGAAMVRGVQAEHVMACLKHYAFNSMENARFKVDIDCDPRTEREIFLPHFKEGIDAGAKCVMTAYNSYKGKKCGHQDHLIREVLKGDWGFKGFTITDFYWGISDTVAGADGGTDVEMTSPVWYGDKLKKAVADGLVDKAVIDEAAYRIASTVGANEEAWQKACDAGEVPYDRRPDLPPGIIELGNKDIPVYDPAVLGCKEHQKLALKAAEEGITLIKNEGNVLPFSKKIRRIALIGEAVMRRNTGDHGSSRVYPSFTRTLLDGVREQVPDVEVIVYDGDNISHLKRLAASADAVVLAVGLDYQDEGEYNPITTDIYNRGKRGGDRDRLSLSAADERLLKEAGSINPNTAAIVFSGGTITMENWETGLPAILMAYYPGQLGGTALGEILFGKVNPSGHLPHVIPRRQEDLQPINWNADTFFYEYLHGYQYMEARRTEPYRPFGYGLSYTTFELSEPSFERKKDQVRAQVTVTNTGKVKGSTVIQVYAGFPESRMLRPPKKLIGFARVETAPGKAKKVTVSCPVEKLKYWDETQHEFMLEPMNYRFYIGTSSADGDLLAGEIKLK